MMTDINLYSIKMEYIDYLRKVDSKVPNANYHKKGKFEKIYCGIILKINEYSYFAPLSHQTSNPDSSFVLKHSDGREYASLRLKFMIPISNLDVVTIKDIGKETDVKYKGLLSQELTYCRQNSEKIKEKAMEVYTNQVERKKGFHVFCCNFKALESAADKYSK